MAIQAGSATRIINCEIGDGLCGGGYSGDPTFCCRLEPEAGYKIVDATARLLHTLWPRE